MKKKIYLLLIMSLPLVMGSCSAIKKMTGKDCDCPRWGQQVQPENNVTEIAADNAEEIRM